ncbi:MAG: DUF935 family protein [Candidatus Aenigmatarchaeota archaeon]
MGAIKSRRDEIEKQQVVRELGVSGIPFSYGTIFEERLPKLQGVRAREIYKQMSENDPVIGGTLLMIEQSMRSVRWKVDPENETPEAKQDADFIWSAMHDMSHTWQDFITDVLSMLVYGWSYFEIVYKVRGGGSEEGDPTIRSRYNDGLLGWRKLAYRAQTSLDRWELDERGGVRGLWQRDPNSSQLLFIPITKSLHFRTKPAGGNPEGRSILRPAFRPWFFKKYIEEVEGIGIERDLVGLPKAIAPEGVDVLAPSNTALYNAVTDMLKKIRQDKYAGIILPYGWQVELMSSGGSRQIDTISVIARYDQRIALSVLAQFIMLGTERVGSYALASQQKDMFTIALEGWLFSIEQVVNRFGVQRLIALNNRPTVPVITHEAIVQPTLEEIGIFLRDMANVGLIAPDPQLEVWLRQRASMPVKTVEREEEAGSEQERVQEAMQQQRKEALAAFDRLPENVHPNSAVDAMLPWRLVEQRFSEAYNDEQKGRALTRRLRRRVENVLRAPLTRLERRARLVRIFKEVMDHV